MQERWSDVITCLMNMTPFGFVTILCKMVACTCLSSLIFHDIAKCPRISSATMYAQVKWRHVHFAAASLAISEQLENFRAMNRQAISHGRSNAGVDGGNREAVDAVAMRRLVNALPQYRRARPIS